MVLVTGAAYGASEPSVCAELASYGDNAEVVVSAEVKAACNEPEPAPVMLDCNDARMSVLLEQMIGSCDMPTNAVTPPLHSSQPPRGNWLCESLSCGDETMPLRSLARDLDDWRPLAAAKLYSPRFSFWHSLSDDADLLPPSVVAPRIEKPPRC